MVLFVAPAHLPSPPLLLICCRFLSAASDDDVFGEVTGGGDEDKPSAGSGTAMEVDDVQSHDNKRDAKRGKYRRFLGPRSIPNLSAGAVQSGPPNNIFFLGGG